MTAASGKDVTDMEEAIEADSLAEFDKKIRNRVLDLNDLSVDELTESDRNSFHYSIDKITAASIDPARRTLLRSHGAAVLVLNHKSKGEIAFEFPAEDDVDRAIDYLPDLLDDLLKINVRWDRAKECFIAR